jgi:hypothetical protein
MLLHNVPSKPVRVDMRAPFRIGQNIDFAVCLLEGLCDSKMRKPLPPCHHLIRIGLHRMPEPDAHAPSIEIEPRAGRIQRALCRRQARDPVPAEFE